MKAADLREKSVEDLKELEKTLAKEFFDARFKNFTNRLDDTSAMKKAKKDIARVKTLLTQHEKGLVPVKGEAKTAKAGTKAKKKDH